MSSAPAPQQAAPSSAALAGWPLLHLPDAAKELVVASLPSADQLSLRAACQATQELTEACITALCFSADGLFKAGLQRRFSRLRVLHIDAAANSEASDEDEGQLGQQALREGVDLLVGDGPFISVKELHFVCVPAATAALMVAACPNAEVCSIGPANHNVPPEPYLDIPRAVRFVCTTLPRLRTLDVGKCSLDDEDLQQLSGRSTLQALTAALDGCQAGEDGGWAALMRMAQLTSLHVHREWQQLPAGVELDMRAMTGLRRLRFSDADQEAAEQYGAWQPDMAYQTMQLPSANLAFLNLHQLPVPALALPTLTALQLLGLAQFAVLPEQLARIAAGCPALASLQLAELVLDDSAHKAPLLALQALGVFRVCTVARNARFALVFPRLRTLHLLSECRFEGGAAAFVGMAALEVLDIGRGRRPVQAGLELAAGDFSVLAALPRLQELRLNVGPDHIEGLNAIMRLESVALVFDVERHLSYAGVPDAFASARPGPLLQSAKVEWFTGHPFADPDVLETRPFLRLICGAADAAILYMVRAPALSHVGWDAADSTACAAITDMRIIALAGNTSIKRIDVRQHFKGTISQGIAQHVMQLGGARGLVVSFAWCAQGDGIKMDAVDG